MTIENRTGLVRREQVQTTTTVEEVVARGTAERRDPLDVSLRGRAFQASPAERMHYLQMLLDAGFGEAIAGQVAEAIAREMWASTMRPLPASCPYVPPFYDAPAQALGPQLLEQFFVALGVPPQLATAAAQWFAQMIAPPQFYQPLWQGVGGRGDFDLDRLRQLMRGRGLELSDGVQDQRLRNSMMIRPGAPRRARESADELIDRALRGSELRSPERRQRFDVDSSRRRRRSDPAADLLRARTEGGGRELTNAREVVDRLKEKLQYGVFDWVITDSEARDVIRELSQYDHRGLAQLVEHLGPDLLARLESNLTGADKATYRSTLDRIRRELNGRREAVDDPRQLVDELKSKLSYGLVDWVVTDSEARSVIDKLSRLGDRDLREIAEHVGPDLLTRLEENLTDADKTTYRTTLDRLRAIRNEPGRNQLRDIDAVAAELRNKLSYGVFDWAVTDGEARAVIDQLSRYSPADLRKLVDKLGPDLTNRLIDNLTSADSTTYAATIERLREARNAPGRKPLTNARDVVSQIESNLSYGAFDWVITDSEARAVVHELSQYSNEDLRRLVRMIDPSLLARLEPNLSDQDKATYAETLRRIRAAR